MNYFIVLTLTGIAAGMIYSALALALVLIWRATRIVNFAQGAMAMTTTYIALAVIQATDNYWLGFAAAIAAGFAIGANFALSTGTLTALARLPSAAWSDGSRRVRP